MYTHTQLKQRRGSIYNCLTIAGSHSFHHKHQKGQKYCPYVLPNDPQRPSEIVFGVAQPESKSFPLPSTDIVPWVCHGMAFTNIRWLSAKLGSEGGRPLFFIHPSVLCCRAMSSVSYDPKMVMVRTHLAKKVEIASKSKLVWDTLKSCRFADENWPKTVIVPELKTMTGPLTTCLSMRISNSDKQ